MIWVLGKKADTIKANKMVSFYKIMHYILHGGKKGTPLDMMTVRTVSLNAKVKSSSPY